MGFIDEAMRAILIVGAGVDARVISPEARSLDLAPNSFSVVKDLMVSEEACGVAMPDDVADGLVTTSHVVLLFSQHAKRRPDAAEIVTAVGLPCRNLPRPQRNS